MSLLISLFTFGEWASPDSISHITSSEAQSSAVDDVFAGHAVNNFQGSSILFFFSKKKSNASSISFFFFWGGGLENKKLSHVNDDGWNKATT